MRINRDRYLKQLKAARGNGLIKIVTGLRRSGKTYLLFDIFHEWLSSEGVDERHIIEVALDDLANKPLRNPEKLLNFIRSSLTDQQMHYVILDEVQLVEDFTEVLNSLLHDRNVDVYVTGSNSHFLSSDIATAFRGRGFVIHLHPLTFSEYLSVFDGSQDEAWEQYYTYGGLPLVLTLPGEKAKSDYLADLFRTVYLSDIKERHDIRNPEEFLELSQVLASSIGSPVNPLKLSNTFKSEKHSNISSRTIARYLGYLNDAFITQKALRYDIKGKKYIGTLAKYYFSDIGLRNALLGFRQQEESHIMENIIYNELLSRGYKVDVGHMVIRTTDKHGHPVRKSLEVDFVVNEGSQRYYIQSALDMPSREKVEQETRGLLGIPDSFRKIVVVKDRIKLKRDEKGITTMSIFEFLMNPDSLSL